MLTQNVEKVVRFTRRDATRLFGASAVLVVVLTIILGVDVLLPQPGAISVGDPAPRDMVSPSTTEFDSVVQTDARRKAAADAVPPQYDYTTDKAIAVAAEQLASLRRSLISINSAFEPSTKKEDRAAILEQSLPNLSSRARETLLALAPARWPAVRDEATRVLDATERTELKDSELAPTRLALAGRISRALTEAERTLAAELISPFVVANSSYSAARDQAERQRVAAEVPLVHVRIRVGQVIVRAGDPITRATLETLTKLRLTNSGPEPLKFAGWLLLASIVVALLLAWVWRFRRDLWHRNNVLALVGLLLVFAVFALKLTAGRPTLPFLLPTAALGMLVAILLDAGAATVLMAVLAVIAGAVNANSLEVAAYVFLGGFAGIIAVRRGDRLQAFLQSGIAIFLVSALTVATFSLLGTRDLRGVLELWGASAAAAGGAAVAAVGSFAVLGNIFGILTAFQLLELANPSQPLLRRLLVETPGTYHHSIMVGNLAERAAEAIGADPLITRVAAYYHDIGKMKNPLAFIENQSGGENIHDILEPEESAQILKQHVADGIDVAYQSKLPKTLIAFIPQHHGTSVMAYFVAKAREEAAAPYGGLDTVEGERAADTVDVRRFRHAGPKPQSREAALLMLADGVEASVRSLASRDEPAIRTMVARIISDRMEDGQFDECDLTLRDIGKAQEAFVSQLLGVYHQRVAYPTNKVVELESRRAAGGGGNTPA